MKTPALMRETMAKMVAAECPLTWVQVRNLAYFAALEDGRKEFETWLNWGPYHEVAEWLWQYWIENAVDHEDGQEEAPNLLSYAKPAWGHLPEPTKVPVTARGVGQKPLREIGTIDWCPSKAAVWPR